MGASDESRRQIGSGIAILGESSVRALTASTLGYYQTQGIATASVQSLRRSCNTACHSAQLFEGCGPNLCFMPRSPSNLVIDDVLTY